MTSNLDPAALEAAIKTYGRYSSRDANEGALSSAITAYLDTLSHAGEGEPDTGEWSDGGKVWDPSRATPRPDTAEGERVSIETLRHECAANGPCSDYIDGCTCTDAELQKRHARALSKPAPQAEGVSEAETGWLIELGTRVTVTPQWWSLPADDEGQWTSDSLKALRFARRQDADAYILEAGWTEAMATEHEWVGPPLARPVDKGEGAPE